MPNYRRLRREGGTYFFTVALAAPGADLLIRRIDLVRSAYLATRTARPFRCEAFVVLPDHLHAVWTLPQGDSDFSGRWSQFKAHVSRALPAARSRSASMIRRREKGLWRRRFWEHLIRDEEDFARHVEYCRTDPVRHGLVRRPADWAFSSIGREIRNGVVPRGWRGDARIAGRFGELSPRMVGLSPPYAREGQPMVSTTLPMARRSAISS